MVSADGRYALLRVDVEDIEDSEEAVGAFVDTDQVIVVTDAAAEAAGRPRHPASPSRRS